MRIPVPPREFYSSATRARSRLHARGREEICLVQFTGRETTDSVAGGRRSNEALQPIHKGVLRDELHTAGTHLAFSADLAPTLCEHNSEAGMCQDSWPGGDALILCC